MKFKLGRKYKPTETEMLHLEAYQDWLELHYFAHPDYVASIQKPASTVCMGEVGLGKTEMMKKYAHNNGIAAESKFTAWGIQDNYLVDITNGKIKHLMMYDMDLLRSYSPHTVRGTVGALCGLIEEGVWSVSDYSTRNLPKYTGLKCGFIGGISNKVWTDGRVSYFTDAFRSRVDVFSFGYTKAAIEDIQDSIELGEYVKRFTPKIDLDFPSDPVKVVLPRKYAHPIRTLSERIQEEFLPPRPHKRLRALVMASAVRSVANKKRCPTKTEVSPQDVGRIFYLSKWINDRMNPME